MITGLDNKKINKGRQKIVEKMVRHGYDACLIQILQDIEGTIEDLNRIHNYIYINHWSSDYTDQQLADEIKRCIELCISMGYMERLPWLLPSLQKDKLLGNDQKAQILNIPEHYNLVLDKNNKENMDDIYFLINLYRYQELTKNEIDFIYAVYCKIENKKPSYIQEYLWSLDKCLPEILVVDIQQNKEKSLLYLALKNGWILNGSTLECLQKTEDLIADWVSKGEMEKIECCFDSRKDGSQVLDKTRLIRMQKHFKGEDKAVQWVRSIYNMTAEDNSILLNPEIDLKRYKTVKNLFPKTTINIPLEHPAGFLSIKLNDEKYVNLCCYAYDTMMIKKNGEIKPGGKLLFNVKMTLYPNFSFSQTLSKSGKVIPLSCKTIYSLAKQCKPFKKFIIAYLEHISSDCPIAKDLLRELVDTETEWVLPISLQEILQYHNKQDLFMNKYKIAQDLRINYNKLSFSLSYIIIKTYPYLDTKSREVLVNIRDESLMEDDPSRQMNNYIKLRGYKAKISTFIWRYYNSILQGLNESNDDGKKNQIILQDYLQMAFELKEKISLRYRSIKKLDDEHDRLAQEIMKKTYKKSKLKIPKNSKFNNLRTILPQEFEWIKSKNRLFWEGKIQDHCVFAYINEITKDHCAIYSYTDNTGEYTKIWKGKPVHYTIAFEYNARTKHYGIQQVQGYKNCVDTEKMEKYIQYLLDKAQKAKTS